MAWCKLNHALSKKNAARSHFLSPSYEITASCLLSCGTESLKLAHADCRFVRVVNDYERVCEWKLTL